MRRHATAAVPLTGPVCGVPP